MRILRRISDRAPPEDLPRFPPDQRLLAGHAPVIAAEAAVGAQHAMAGHDERDWVVPHRGSNGAGSGRSAEKASDIRIADGVAHRDPEQGLPDPDFEIRTDE